MTLNEHRRISYLTGVICGTGSSTWLFCGFLRFKERRDSVKPALTLGGFVSMCVRQGAAPRPVSSASFQAQWRLPPSRNPLRGRFYSSACAGKPRTAARSRGMEVWLKHVFSNGVTRRESSAEGYCPFFFSFTTFRWDRMCVDITPARRWERRFA